MTKDEALAHPEQEPVAWSVVGDGKFGMYELGHTVLDSEETCTYWKNRGYEVVPLYTAPPQRPWVGLTDDEVSNIIDDVIGFNSCWGPETDFARAIEAKLKEKNT